MAKRIDTKKPAKPPKAPAPERLVLGFNLVHLSGAGGPHGGVLELRRQPHVGAVVAGQTPAVVLEFAGVAGVDSLIWMLQRVRAEMAAEPYTLAA